MLSVNLDLGIISGEKKRALECYVDSRYFTQRKSYDEYYVVADNVSADLGINDLMILAENFTVTITVDSVDIA